MSGTDSNSAERLIARARASLGAENYRVAIRAGHHDLVADERPFLGGRDAGPGPYEYLLSGLGACTAITLRMYAERKGWDLDSVDVSLRFMQGETGQRIDRTIAVQGELSKEQRARLADIAERTPVTLTLKTGVEIVTTLGPAG